MSGIWHLAQGTTSINDVCFARSRGKARPFLSPLTQHQHSPGQRQLLNKLINCVLPMGITSILQSKVQALTSSTSVSLPRQRRELVLLSQCSYLPSEENYLSRKQEPVSTPGFHSMTVSAQENSKPHEHKACVRDFFGCQVEAVFPSSPSLP